MYGRVLCLWMSLLLLGWLCPPVGAAQGPGDSPPSSPADAPAADEPQYSFAVEIEVVTVPVTVTNPAGDFVTDLDKNEFLVQDNGVRQKIESLELSGEPLSLAVVIETSARIQSLLPEVRQAGILITNLILGESGEAAVLTFDRDIQLVQDFTNSSDLIEKAFRNLQPGADSVRLSDALARALFLLQRRPEGRRKAIIAISEARDQGSSTPQGLVLRSAQQLGISVYTVGLSSYRGLLGRPSSEGVSSPFPPGVMARPMPANQPPTPDAQTNWGAANADLLPLLAELVTTAKSLITGNPLTVYAVGTGGEDFSSGDKGQLEKALGRIGQELHNQYLLTYRPNNLEKQGFHTIRVAVLRPDVAVRTRPGYLYLPQAPKSPASSPSGSSPSPEAKPAGP